MKINLRCAGPAWIVGWAIAVFLPSALIACRMLSVMGAGMSGLPGKTWEVADAMAPGAKLLLGGLLAILFLASTRFSQGGRSLLALGALSGIAAILVTLAILPAEWSRGFGIRLTGIRFDAVTLPAYLIGAGVGGLAYALAFRRCGRSA